MSEITPEKRAELRARKQARKDAQEWERRNEESRSWKPLRPGRDARNCRVPGWEKLELPKYTPANPPPRRKRKKRSKSVGRGHNGCIERIGCNSEYERGHGKITTRRIPDPPRARMSYVQAVQHGLVEEN